jgi:hypothetical protein
MTMRIRLGSEVAAAVLRLPSRRAARSVVRVVHARVRVVLRSYYTVLRARLKRRLPRFVEARVRWWCLSRRVGFAEGIHPGEFRGEDHAGTFGMGIVGGWTGECVDEAEFLRAREAFDGHLAPRGGGPVRRRLGVSQAHRGIPAKSLGAPRARTAVLLDASPDVHGDAAVQLPALGLHDVHVPRLRGGGGERERRAHAGHGGARAKVTTRRGNL